MFTRRDSAIPTYSKVVQYHLPYWKKKIKTICSCRAHLFSPLFRLRICWWCVRCCCLAYLAHYTAAQLLTDIPYRTNTTKSNASDEYLESWFLSRVRSALHITRITAQYKPFSGLVGTFHASRGEMPAMHSDWLGGTCCLAFIHVGGRTKWLL